MRSKKALLNTITSLSLEIVTIISGFVLPRLILSIFGSSYNGVISAINQFIRYVSLLSAGIGGVTRASLYKPLEEGNIEEVSAIIKATEFFMRKVAMIFAFGLLAFASLYPLLVKEEFDWFFTFTLVLIVGISTFFQYYFGITYKMLIQADQRQYIFITFQVITTFLNTIVAAILMVLGFSIHIVQLGSALVYILNPLAIYIYTRRRYKLIHDIKPNNRAIEQRWDAFAHQIANFVNKNTDLVLLSFFTNLREISVYTVYSMVVNGVRKFIDSFITGVEAAFGNMIARGEKVSLDRNVSIFEFLIYNITIILFTSTGILITSFVAIYTKGITDVDYHRVGFGYLLVVSEVFSCLRMPYQLVANAAGHYRETRNGAIIEAGLNIIISLIFVKKLGLVGVLIGTLAAMIFRTMQYSIYVSSKILYRSIFVVIKKLFISILNVLGIISIVQFLRLPTVDSYYAWAANGFIVFSIAVAVTGISSMLFYREDIRGLIRIIKGLRKGHKN